ncbi:MAG: CoxG family protein [Cyclobacteriaceae bacterium]
MKTSVNKTFQVDQHIDKVWDFLSDPNKVVVCVQGASIVEQVDDKNYKGQVSMKFGPVSAKYNGQIAIEELDAANKKMVLKGNGMDAKGKGSADMIMRGSLAEKDGGTEVDYQMDITITGTLAQFGSRLINDVTGQVVNQFIANFKKELSTPPVGAVGGAEAAPAKKEKSLNAFALMWAVIKGFFARLFGKSS